MRNWTEKHIRELVRAWYNRGGSEISLTDWSNLVIQTDDFETHLIYPLLDENGVVREGRIDKIEFKNLNIIPAGENDARYTYRCLIITGDIPATSSTNTLLIRVPLPIRIVPTTQSIIVNNGNIRHGPYTGGTLGWVPFTGRAYVDDTAFGAGDTQSGYISDGVRYSDGGYRVSSGRFDPGALSGGLNNPFGLVRVQYATALSLSGVNDYLTIELNDTPASHELILFPDGVTNGVEYRQTQASLMDLPSRT